MCWGPAVLLLVTNFQTGILVFRPLISPALSVLSLCQSVHSFDMPIPTTEKAQLLREYLDIQGDLDVQATVSAALQKVEARGSLTQEEVEHMSVEQKLGESPCGVFPLVARTSRVHNHAPNACAACAPPLTDTLFFVASMEFNP